MDFLKFSDIPTMRCSKCGIPLSINNTVQKDRQSLCRECAGVYPTEAEMRDADVPWPKTEEELESYIRSLVDRPHDYGTCVYAMSMAATAAFYYVASRLGVTGFQAGCADLDILRRIRHLKAGFRILNYENLLYPQYLNKEHFPSIPQLLEENEEKLAELAKAKLLESDGKAHPDVIAHWKYLVNRAETGKGEG